MQVMSYVGELRTIECACGCGQMIEIEPSLLEGSAANRVKDEYQPLGYYESHDGFIVSGATGYVYASLQCLNSMNED
jgi:hypothetical protein